MNNMNKRERHENPAKTFTPLSPAVDTFVPGSSQGSFALPPAQTALIHPVPRAYYYYQLLNPPPRENLPLRVLVPFLSVPVATLKPNSDLDKGGSTCT